MLPTKLPFYFGANDTKGNGGFAEALPFHIYFDKELKMYRQVTSPELKGTLQEVYELGSLVDGSISNESGAVYIEKVSRFIKEQFGMAKPSVLEIGCGNGVILKALKDTGADLLGLEPGDHGGISGIENIKIIHDFFPSKELENKFDLIYSLFVLEHIEDPVAFLKLQAEYLNDNGSLLFGVPNCDPFLRTGDISIFIHEHYSYFTKKNVYEVAERAGLKIMKAEVIEGMLMVAVKKKNTEPYIGPGIEEFNPEDFEEKISGLNKKMIDLFDQYGENEIAVYVPGRAINTLYLAGKVNCRLVDDNSEIHGKYLPAFINPIESFRNMTGNPPRLIFIYSRTFGERIKAKCLAEPALASVKLLTLNDLEK